MFYDNVGRMKLCSILGSFAIFYVVRYRAVARHCKKALVKGAILPKAEFWEYEIFKKAFWLEKLSGPSVIGTVSFAHYLMIWKEILVKKQKR